MDDILGKLRQWFSSDDELRPTGDDDVRLASAALLVHAMRIDDETSPAERERLRDVLAQRFDVTGAELVALIDAARAQDDEAVDLYRFTRLLTANLDQPGRIEIVRMMWEIAVADGEIHEFEANLVWRVAELLGVASEDRIRLRQEVLAAS
ncbi:MAG: TerB family tellurite resistance protein [Pseudomonadota bacterium]